MNPPRDDRSLSLADRSLSLADRSLSLADRSLSSADRSLALAALAVAGATLLSGPVGLALAAIRPQPPWAGAETFAAHFHPLQQAPFWFGFLLIGACVWFVARATAVDGERHPTRARAALICTGAFAAMIGINYTLQVAFVPHAARAHSPALAYVAMANPGSIGWSLEMFGYGAFGVATWLLAPVLRDRRWGRWIETLLVANGVVSVAGAALTAVELTWVMTTPGLVSFAAWNALLIGAMVLIAAACR